MDDVTRLEAKSFQILNSACDLRKLTSDNYLQIVQKERKRDLKEAEKIASHKVLSTNDKQQNTDTEPKDSKSKRRAIRGKTKEQKEAL